MGHSQYDLVGQGHSAWNAGKRVGVKRPLKVRQIWEIRFFLDREGRHGDRALFDLAIDSKLRGCGGQRLAAAGGMPDVAIAAVLRDGFDNGLHRVDLIRLHHQELLLACDQNHIAADGLRVMDEIAEPRAFGLRMAVAATKTAAGIVTPPLLPPAGVDLVALDLLSLGSATSLGGCAGGSADHRPPSSSSEMLADMPDKGPAFELGMLRIREIDAMEIIFGVTGTG